MVFLSSQHWFRFFSHGHKKATGVLGITSRQNNIQRKKRGHLFLGFTLLTVMSPFPEAPKPLTLQWLGKSQACPKLMKELDHWDLTWLEFTNESCGKADRDLSKIRALSVGKECGIDSGRTSHSICKHGSHFLWPQTTPDLSVQQFQKLVTAIKRKHAGFYLILRYSYKVLLTVLRFWVLKKKQLSVSLAPSADAVVEVGRLPLSCWGLPHPFSFLHVGKLVAVTVTT